MWSVAGRAGETGARPELYEEEAAMKYGAQQAQAVRLVRV